MCFVVCHSEGKIGLYLRCMEKRPAPGTEQRLLDTSLWLLVAYNALFLADLWLEDTMPGGPAAQAMKFIDARRGWVTLFEAVAATSLFLDLIVRFDQYQRLRSLRIAGVAIAGAGLVFKAFAFYLDSSYLE